MLSLLWIYYRRALVTIKSNNPRRAMCLKKNKRAIKIVVSDEHNNYSKSHDMHINQNYNELYPPAWL